MTLTRRHALALAAAAAVLPTAAGAAPKSRLIDDRWTRFGNAGDPDHGGWAAILSRHLSSGHADGVARFDYAAADRGAIGAYIDQLAGVTATDLSREAAYAYWVNMYNAVTVWIVLEEYPIDSIREVRGGLFNTGPWGEKLVTVEGQSLSLDDIEHGILRPVWRDPRIHYAVNCASIGCPNLAPAPYTAAALETMLEEGARAYVNHPRGAAVEGGRLLVSSIYEWFKEDFGDTDAGVIAHLKQYATGAHRDALAQASRLADDRYDWSLNDTARVSG
ncbi:MAG: DUF547 domain-containing protein [Pseudomonadota bacterium]